MNDGTRLSMLSLLGTENKASVEQVEAAHGGSESMLVVVVDHGGLLASSKPAAVHVRSTWVAEVRVRTHARETVHAHRSDERHCASARGAGRRQTLRRLTSCRRRCVALEAYL